MAGRTRRRRKKQKEREDHSVPLFPDHPVLCLECRHYVRSDRVCRAFPRGIPEEIRRGDVDHRDPYFGDGGLQFAPIYAGPGTHSPSDLPKLTAGEVKAWLAELDRLRDEPGAPEETRVRILEHIELATVYLGWLEKDSSSEGSP